MTEVIGAYLGARVLAEIDCADARAKFDLQVIYGSEGFLGSSQKTKIKHHKPLQRAERPELA